MVPIDPLLPGHGANYGRCGSRELRPSLPDARVLCQTDRHENHYAPVRHMDRQLDTGHITVHLQIGTRLLCQKGSPSTYSVLTTYTFKPSYFRRHFLPV